ncbi:MAG: GNAT family N-acetyltransferase [Chitinophagaceae bacterium]
MLFHYRNATQDDVQSLKALGIASYGQFAPLLTTDNQEKLFNFLNNENGWKELIQLSQSFICTQNDIVIGMAFLIPHGNPTDIYPIEWCYIRMVGVHPEYSGKGIGKTLTRMCIDKAKELNEKIVGLHTSEFMDSARHIYEGLGFTIVKEIPPRYGKKYWLYKLNIDQ